MLKVVVESDLETLKIYCNILSEHHCAKLCRVNPNCPLVLTLHKKCKVTKSAGYWRFGHIY